jgi:hypothetical protein
LLAEDRVSGDPLLLQHVNVLVVAAEGVETSMLRSILEASGATVSVTNGKPNLEAVPVSHADVTFTDAGADSWMLNFSQSDERSQLLPKSTSPSDIVRRIARLLKPSNAR